MNVAGFHLTYCSNIHPGETWPAVRSTLGAAIPRLRALLGFDGEFAIGLRLSAAAAEALEQPEALSEFGDFLRASRCYVPTINGFPFGAFHGQRVKEDVYLPDWRDAARVDYSNRLARLLAALAAGSGGVEASVSTVPGAFKANVRSDADEHTIALNVLRHAAFLIRLRRDTGVTVTLALEPEPACLLETTADAVRFFSAYLFNVGFVTMASEAIGEALTVEAIRRHVGVCFDACHMAVQFEDPGQGLADLRRAGIPVAKVQISSALRLDGRTPADIRTALAPFAEDTYLHQVVERAGGAFHRYDDLPQALAAASASDSRAPRDWRVHFHVPVFLSDMRALGTTQPYLIDLIKVLKRDAVTRCLEVETYTWDVLPAEYRASDVCTAIARELSWTRDQLQA